MQVVRPEIELNVGGRGDEEQQRGRDRKFQSLSLTQLQRHYKSKKGKCHKCGLAPRGICLNGSQPHPGQGQVSLCREGILHILCLLQDESPPVTRGLEVQLPLGEAGATKTFPDTFFKSLSSSSCAPFWSPGGTSCAVYAKTHFQLLDSEWILKNIFHMRNTVWTGKRKQDRPVILWDKKSANPKLAGGLSSNSALVSSKTQIYELGFVKVGYGFLKMKRMDGRTAVRHLINVIKM